MGETGRNTWTYQEFKGMPHYESLQVCEASTDTVLSCPSARIDVISKLLLSDFMRFDIDEFNDNLTGHFMLDRIMLGKDICR
jgi:hypothetical protein